MAARQRADIAERRPLLVFCARCGVTSISRNSAMESRVSTPLSPPSVTFWARSA